MPRQSVVRTSVSIIAGIKIRLLVTAKISITKRLSRRSSVRPQEWANRPRLDLTFEVLVLAFGRQFCGGFVAFPKALHGGASLPCRAPHLWVPLTQGIMMRRKVGSRTQLGTFYLLNRSFPSESA